MKFKHPLFLKIQDKCYYTRLLLVNYCNNNNDIALSNARSFTNINKSIQELLEQVPDAIFIINCECVTINTTDHSTDENNIKHRDKIIFLSDDNITIKRIKNEFGFKKISFGGGGWNILFKTEMPTIIPNNIQGMITLEESSIKKFIRESYAPNNKDDNGDPKFKQGMSSSFIQTNGTLNARKIISDPRKFMWVAYKLMQLYLKINTDNTKNICFLAVSLQATPLAVVVKSMVKMIYKKDIKLEIIDHMGPNYNVVEGMQYASNDLEMCYIYFADFILGGTELKLAQSHIGSRKGTLKGVIALGNYLKKYNTLGEDILLESIIHFANLTHEGTEFKVKLMDPMVINTA